MEVNKLLFKKSIFILILALSLFQSACYAEKPISEIYKNSPQDVLVGTDVQNLSTFKSTGSFVSGIYLAEMGGANLTLKVDVDVNNIKIERSFQEPGLPKKHKSYTVNLSKESHVDNEDISLIMIKNGILLHEKNPKIMGIPADLWVLYTKK